MKKFYIPYIVFCVLILTLSVININQSSKNTVKHTPPSVSKPMEVDIKSIDNDKEIIFILYVQIIIVFFYMTVRKLQLKSWI